MQDPALYPTAEDDWYPDDDDIDAPEGDEEWQPGQCDNCAGGSGSASGITPVCACAIGQGAAPEDCICGPESN